MFEREAIPSDRFANPYPNVQAARAANNGAYPPDLSLIVKARPKGADYLKALLLAMLCPLTKKSLMDNITINTWMET